MGRNCLKTINLTDTNGKPIESDSVKAEVLNDYFLQSIRDIRSKIEQSPLDSCNSLRTLIQHNDRCYFHHATYDDIYLIISNLKPGKSSGHDNILPWLLLDNKDEFTPYLVNIINNMINTSVYPEILKIHKVVPISKKINSTIPEMYRPISVLSVVDNVFERVLYNQISTYMEMNHLLNDFQYGFRKGCGTEEAVVNVINFICKGLDEGYCGVVGVFFDLTKAFDLIDHEILCRKLRYYGICGKELLLLKSYLASRKQFVQINT